MKLLSVPIDELALGMYVAKLDRPWLETPFLFQGFLIEDDHVLGQLREYCKYVYVDPTQSDPSVRNSGESERQSKTGRDTRSRTRLVPKRADHPADDAVQWLRDELPQAREAHQQAETVIGDAISRIRDGKRIDLEKLGDSFDLMIGSVTRNPDALAWITRMKKKDDYVYEHSIASSVWAAMFGRQIGLDSSEILLLSTGAMLMDVGKTKLDDALLTKPRLSKAEVDVVRRHVHFGLEIVDSSSGVDPRVRDIVAYHHERHDGSGYPNGLSGSDIPLFARLAGVIDTYDAMTQPRPYAKAKSTSDAIRELNSLAGKSFAREVIEQFVETVGVFPVGSLIELNTGEVGVVIAQHKIRRLEPKIMLLLGRDKERMSEFPVIDLFKQGTLEGKPVHIERGLAPDAFGIDPSEYFL